MIAKKTPTDSLCKKCHLKKNDTAEFSLGQCTGSGPFKSGPQLILSHFDFDYCRHLFDLKKLLLMIEMPEETADQ